MTSVAPDSVVNRLQGALPQATQLPRNEPAPVPPVAPRVSTRRSTTVLLCLGLWSMLSFILVRQHVISSVLLSGESMLPTLKPGDSCLVHTWLARVQGYRRGDIVLFRDPVDHDLCVKRIIGLPGEEIRFVRGKVLIDGQPLEEPYLDGAMFTLNPKRDADAPLRIGPHQYFVMGDNRTTSLDSRFIGPIPHRELLGKLLVASRH
jgi:signal peptidase I